MAEDPAPYADQRQHTGNARCVVARSQIDAFVAEDARNDRLPAVEVKMRPAVGRANERVPLVRGPRVLIDDGQSARFETLALMGRLAGASSFRHRAAVVKRNSARSCSMRGSVRVRPP